MFLVVMLCLLLAIRRNETFGDTIYVAISSYRDAECLATVRDCFAKADNKQRVFVGICEQNKEAKESCTAGLEVDMSHVRLLELKHTQAKGPTYARYLCANMYGGEDYFLQIDSHSRFVQGWDSKLVGMLAKCPSSKPVLTHYPHAYDADPKELKELLPVMCKSSWNDDGLPTFEAILQPTAQAALRRVPFCAGGLLFAKGSLLRDVPMDPSLDYLFAGEEVLLSARLFTSAYDLFTPDENVLTHHYERHEGPRFWQDLPNYRTKQKQAIKRAKCLLGLEVPDLSLIDPYGMGNQRTLAEWWQFAGLDPTSKTSSSSSQFCV